MRRITILTALMLAVIVLFASCVHQDQKTPAAENVLVGLDEGAQPSLYAEEQQEHFEELLQLPPVKEKQEEMIRQTDGENAHFKEGVYYIARVLPSYEKREKSRKEELFLSDAYLAVPMFATVDGEERVIATCHVAYADGGYACFSVAGSRSNKAVELLFYGELSEIWQGEEPTKVTLVQCAWGRQDHMLYSECSERNYFIDAGRSLSHNAAGQLLDQYDEDRISAYVYEEEEYFQALEHTMQSQKVQNGELLPSLLKELPLTAVRNILKMSALPLCIGGTVLALGVTAVILIVRRRKKTV